VADYVNYALLQLHQPYPARGHRGGGYGLIEKFMRRQIDAATLI
jgi:hypothetical protein